MLRESWELRELWELRGETVVEPQTETCPPLTLCDPGPFALTWEVTEKTERKIKYIV